MLDFIGLGAQKSGTSWAYACLYEHPQICAPIKEIHFFSRPRYENGREWYEAHFKKCGEKKVKGEFSTSYLYSKDAPQRIREMYPNVKLIAILRNPIDRAYSQYRNAIKSGEIPKTMRFEEYDKNETSVRAQGLYSVQLARYFARFPKEQVLVLVYEDIKKDPIAFMKCIYRFLRVDDTFVSGMVHSEINVARTPKLILIDRAMHHVAEFLRRHGGDRIVHAIRTVGIPDLVRSINTTKKEARDEKSEYDRRALASYFHDDVVALSKLVGRDMNTEWGI